MSSNDVPVLTPPAELNHKTLPGLRDAAQPYLDADGPGVVVDLASVKFVNSEGLGFLLHLGKDLAEQKRRLALAGPNRKVDRVIRMIGLDQLVPIFKTTAEAVRHVEVASE